MTDDDRAEVERVRAIAMHTVREAHAIASAAIDQMAALADLLLAEQTMLLQVVYAAGDPQTCRDVSAFLKAMHGRLEHLTARQRVH